MKCETKLQGVEGLKDRLAPINLGPRSSHVHPHLILASAAQNAKYNTIQIHPHPIITTTSTNPVLVKDLTYLHHCNALRHGWAPFPRLLKCVASLGLGIARQHCRLTICIELVELTNSETAATTPSGGGAKSLRSLSSLETGSVWRFLVN